ncbi:hypothetical protein LSH36_169g02015, partial [Paralvinella palmiformis]
FSPLIFPSGQELSGSPQQNLDDLSRGERFLINHRRAIGIIVPVSIWQFFWWAMFFDRGFWQEQYFPTKYPLSLAMITGGTIAGMTSVGGGAVAFPVLTLVLNVPPSIARDVSLMLQSSGMTAASFSIFFMRVCVEWHASILCSLGSLAVIIYGLYVVDPAMSPSIKKLSFVSIWLSFAFVLVILNRAHKRRTFSSIPNFGVWKSVSLVVGGLRRGNLHGLCRHRIGHLRLHGADVAVPDLEEGGHADDRRLDGLQFGDRPLLGNDHD